MSSKIEIASPAISDSLSHTHARLIRLFLFPYSVTYGKRLDGQQNLAGNFRPISNYVFERVLKIYLAFLFLHIS